MGIREISLEEAKVIEKNRIPLGVFIINKKINDKYVGINNDTGDAQVMIFDEEKQCIKWLTL